MLTYVFGHVIWDHLSFTALAFSKTPSKLQQDRMKQYLNLVMAHLPCPGCAGHATKYVRQHPPDTSNGDALYAWLVEFHNQVNKRTSDGKKRHDWTVEEAKDALIARHFGDQKGLIRANAVRREDHLEIKKLRSEVRALEKQLGRPPVEFRECGLEKHLVGTKLRTNNEILEAGQKTTSSDGAQPSTTDLVAMIASLTAVVLLVIVIVLVVARTRTTLPGMSTQKIKV